MNPKDLKEALSLYRKYLVTGWKYRALRGPRKGSPVSSH